MQTRLRIREMFSKLVVMSLIFLHAYMTYYGLWQPFFWELFFLSLRLLGGFLFFGFGTFFVMHLTGTTPDDWMPHEVNHSKMVEKTPSELELLKQKNHDLVIECELMQRHMVKKHEMEVMELDSKLTKSLLANEKLESMIRERDVEAEKAATEINSCKLFIQKQDLKIANLLNNTFREHALAAQKTEDELESVRLLLEEKNVAYEDMTTERNQAVREAAADRKSHRLALERKEIEIANLRKHEATISNLTLVVQKAAKEIESYKAVVEQKTLETARLILKLANAQASLSMESLPENLKRTIDALFNQRLQQQQDKVATAANHYIAQMKEEHGKELARLNQLVEARAAGIPVPKEKVTEEGKGEEEDLAGKNLELEATIALMEEQRDRMLDQVNELKGALLKARPMAVPRSRNQK